jgi:hypothetical protein
MFQDHFFSCAGPSLRCCEDNVMVDTSDVIMNLRPGTWTLEREGPDLKMWRSQDGDGLGVFFFDAAPAIEAPLQDLPALRGFYRTAVAESGFGIVSVDVVTMHDFPSVKMILKSPQEPSGMTYVGSFTIPFEAFSSVVKTQCCETGMTGLRDAEVLDMMLQSGTVRLDEPASTLVGWMQDPYDPEFVAPVMRNLSEDPQWDDRFPDHPLSRCRRILEEAKASISLSEAVLTAPAFSQGSGKGAARRWWSRWAGR